MNVTFDMRLSDRIAGGLMYTQYLVVVMSI